MNPEKTVGVTFVLLGIVSLIAGIATVFATSMMSSVINNPLLGGALSSVGFILNILLIFGILEVILGISSLIAKQQKIQVLFLLFAISKPSYNMSRFFTWFTIYWR